MDATPATYRAAIARTNESIATLERGPVTATAAVLHARLGRQLANLEQGLVRAEALWAQAHAQGAASVLP